MIKKNKKDGISIDNKTSEQIANEIILALKKDKLYEQGKVIADISSSYLEMLNEVNSAYIERLEEILKDFKDVDSAEGKAEEYFDLEKVKAKLGV